MCLRRPSLSTLPMHSWPVSAVVDRSTLSTLGCLPIPALLSISQAGRLAVKVVHGCMPSPISGTPSKLATCSQSLCKITRNIKAPPPEGIRISSTAYAASTRKCGFNILLQGSTSMPHLQQWHMPELVWQCSGLQVLHITGAERLQEDALSVVAPLAATLRELSLRGCSSLRDRAGAHLQVLTQLTSLDIGGEDTLCYHAVQCVAA